MTDLEIIDAEIVMDTEQALAGMERDWLTFERRYGHLKEFAARFGAVKKSA